MILHKRQRGRRLLQTGGPPKVRGRGEGTLVGKARDFLWHYRVLLHAGARPAHALERRLGDHLANKRGGAREMTFAPDNFFFLQRTSFAILESARGESGARRRELKHGRELHFG